jgi:hypothetical protein
MITKASLNREVAYSFWSSQYEEQKYNTFVCKSINDDNTATIVNKKTKVETNVNVSDLIQV